MPEPRTDFQTFLLERGQSEWENVVDINLTESGVHPVTLRELGDMGLDLEGLMDLSLKYVQTNGTPELRTAIAAMYPGATADHIEVTNGAAEANYLLCETLLSPGDEILFEVPNYMQMSGVAANMGASVKFFSLNYDAEWEPNWDELEAALSPRTKLIYISHPNNPTGYIMPPESMKRLVALAESVDAYLVADQIYAGLESGGATTPSFWGLSDRVIVVSGLSKAWGIPGARIGWIVCPPDLAHACWARHDYTTIAPGALSDTIAQFAVREDIREQLFSRGRRLMGANRPIFDEWLATFGGFFQMHPPRAGAYAFVRYDAPVLSTPLCDAIREKHSVLVVAGEWMGLEHFLRFGLGGPPASFKEGLERITPTLEALRAGESITA